MHKYGKIVKDQPTFLNGSYFLLLPSYLANKVHSLVEESVQREVLHTIVKEYIFPIQNGFSPLYFASQNGHTDVVDILLRKGADVNQITTNEVCAYSKPLCLSVPIMRCSLLTLGAHAQRGLQ